MTDPNNILLGDLKESQTLGATVYLDAYVRSMAQQLGAVIPDVFVIGVIVKMIEPLNHATEAIWRSMMNDPESEKAVERFRESLNNLS